MGTGWPDFRGNPPKIAWPARRVSVGKQVFSDRQLSCLHSRCRAHYFVPRRRMDAGHRWVRRAGDRTRRRRLNKLSCAGWIPHDRGFVSGLPHSRERASIRRSAHNRPGGFPTVALPPALRICGFVALSRFPRVAPFGRCAHARSGWASRAIAQINPTISRAIMVVTTTFGLPAAAKRRYRAHNRSCAFQAMSRTAADSSSRRS